MQVPVIQGMIDRRILVNFRIDPEVITQQLPHPFQPKLVNGYTIGGICLIRLKQIRPKGFPLKWGLSSENAAHRIAVEWEVDGSRMEGVYIPRRDTNSHLNSIMGGRIFPGEHHHASFIARETPPNYEVTMLSNDNSNAIYVSATQSEHLPSSSVFRSIEEVSDFFQRGQIGYSQTSDAKRYDGLELRCKNWSMEPLTVTEVQSSYFEDEERFPFGSVQFDSAMLMTNIQHEWHSLEDICCESHAPVLHSLGNP